MSTKPDQVHTDSDQVHEDLVLPYEVTKPGYVPRTFYVAAKVLNQALGKADAKRS